MSVRLSLINYIIICLAHRYTVAFTFDVPKSELLNIMKTCDQVFIKALEVQVICHVII